MANVTELRVALTVKDFGQALAFYRDALGLEQLADWSSESGRVVVLDAGRATLELFDDAQAETVDAIEAGRRVSGTVRLAMQVADSQDVAPRPGCSRWRSAPRWPVSRSAATSPTPPRQPTSRPSPSWAARGSPRCRARRATGLTRRARPPSVRVRPAVRSAWSGSA